MAHDGDFPEFRRKSVKFKIWRQKWKMFFEDKMGPLMGQEVSLNFWIND